MGKHTKGPWKLDKTKHVIGVIGKDFQPIEIAEVLPLKNNSNMDEEEANADLIVACVNGCAGLNPEAYQELVNAARMAAKYLMQNQECGASYATLIRALAHATQQKGKE